ncbi:NosD domain-containing protein [Planctomycetota bacterium]
MRTSVFIIICLVVAIPCFSATYIVDPNGSYDFTTIQEAINASWDGDTVIVRPATYNEGIFFNGRAITLTSEDPDDPCTVDTTIITAEHGDNTVNFDFDEDTDSILTGFTIINKGIYCLDSSPTISKNIIKNCEPYGGIYGEHNAQPTIVNNIITNNTAYDGGGLYGCDGTISNNTISGNTATSNNYGVYGGGLYDCDGTITNNTITGNTASGLNVDAYGGGLYGCGGTISNNTISGNTASSNMSSFGGGLYNCGGEISNNMISVNTALSGHDAYGGGLYDCDGTISNNTISGNTATGGNYDAYGGGLHDCGGEIINNIISGNTACGGNNGYGGGLNSCGGEIINNTISGNTACGDNAYGGGLNSSYCCGNIKNNIIAFNEADDEGGGMYGKGGNSYNDFYGNTPDNLGGSAIAGTGDIITDPLFADAGAGDYHLKSEAGRWDPNTGSWVIDDVTSGCIDAGNPGDDYSVETLPNGGRINMGAYGNTNEASKTNTPLVLTLLNPNGGEQIIAGHHYIISWSSNYPAGDILIEYSTDNGQSYSVITTTEDTGSYEWLVPAVVSQQCLIKVSSVIDPFINDTSDDVFGIYELLLSFTSPNGGEAILKGTTFEITWSSGLPPGDVLIEYSANNGENWNDLALTEDTGSYLWQVTTPASNQYLLWISDANGTDANDITDSIFSVYDCNQRLIGDLNGDCIVDDNDLALLTQNWLVTSYARIFYTGLDSNPNWTTQGQWDFGQPAGNGGAEWGNPDPDSGKTGSNVYGVNLYGDYDLAVGGPYCLTAGPFDCNNFTDIKLKFARWLNTDFPLFVASRIEVSNDDSNWQLLWENTTEVTDDSWQTVEYDMSQMADGQPEVYIRWSYEILDDRAYPYSGWNIDDIELLGKP